MKETPIFEEVFSRAVQQSGFWLKVVVGGLLSFIPVVNFFAFGYLLRYSEGVRERGLLGLPNWDDWSRLFTDGLRFAVVWLAYWLLPLLLIYGISLLVCKLGLGALSYLLMSVSFLLSPLLFGAALYRYNSRGDFKDLLDVSLIIRMSYRASGRLFVPAIVFLGIFAIAGPLYGFSFFFAFVILISYTTLFFRSIEQQRKIAL